MAKPNNQRKKKATATAKAGASAQSAKSAPTAAPTKADSSDTSKPVSNTRQWIDRHLWQIQPVRDVLLGIAIVGIFLLGHKASLVTVPMLLALLLAYLFEPVVNWLVVGRGWFSRQGAVSTLIGLVVFIIAVPVTFGIVIAVSQGARFVSQVASTTEGVLEVVRLGDDTKAAMPMLKFKKAKSALDNGKHHLDWTGEDASVVAFKAARDEKQKAADETREEVAELKAQIETQRQQEAEREELRLELETDPPATDPEQQPDLDANRESNETQPTQLPTEPDVIETDESDTDEVDLEKLESQLRAKKNAVEDLLEQVGVWQTKLDGAEHELMLMETSNNESSIYKLKRSFAKLPSLIQTGAILVLNRNSSSTVSSIESVRKYGAVETGLRWVKNNADAIATRAVGSGVDAAATVLRTAKSFGTLLFAGFLTAFFFFFFSTSYPEILSFGRTLLPEKNEDRFVDLVSQMDNVVAGFVRGRLIIALIQSILFSIAYAIIGVPMPLVIGTVVGFLSMIPYVALVGIPVSIIGLVIVASDHEGIRAAWWWIALAPCAVYVALQMLDDYILTPKIQGQSTGMDTPTILFASLAGGALFGVYGLLIAIPIAACVKILLREVFWPRFQAWTDGEVADFLPISRH